MALGSLFFAAPWALLAFAALPALLWLLRATPPPPARQAFPPLRLLLDLRTEETQRHRAPWWLVALRALMASLLILGFARPSWRPPLPAGQTAGPLLLVLDDGWTSAPDWSATRSAALGAVEETERRGGGPVSLLTTAPTGAEQGPLEALAPADAKARLLRLQPHPWRPDRGAAAARLKDAGRFGRVVWLSDGLEAPGDDALRAALQRLGPLAVRTPARTAHALAGAETTAEGVSLAIRRTPGGPAAGAAAVETGDGRSLGAVEFRFPPGEDALTALVPLPAEIAARAAKARLVGEASAGAVRLLAGGAGRPLAGLSAPAEESQPLLADLFYLERAIQPFASPRRGQVLELLDADVQALVLADQGRLGAEELRRLEAWLEAGGVLIRFAGPRLANEPDGLLPAPLRPGARSFGGALAWEKPQTLAPFEDVSPFFGLAIPEDLAVQRQVLAQPYALARARVWARLQDGSPMVTAAPRGKGLLVLFHVTAGPAWSILPLSGLYVEMLRRALAFAGRAEAAASDVRPGPWTPQQVFDGFGALKPVRSQLLAPEDALNAGAPGPATPPGVYARAGSPARVLHAARPEEAMAALMVPPGAQRLGQEAARSAPIAGWLLGGAAALIGADLLLALLLARGFGFPRRGAGTAAGTAALMLVLGLCGPIAPARAQIELSRPPGFGLSPPPQAIENPGDVRLAYIRTGDARADDLARQGLEELGRTLFERTAVEPGPVAAVDPGSDDLSEFPLLYWAAPASPQPPSPRAAAALQRFMGSGGLLLLDTRGLAGNPARVLLQGLDAPPLEPIAARGSIYGKSFYLLENFPGRRGAVQVWAETAAAAAARDGVASLVLGDGDWAGAWAGVDALDAVGARRRELALRFGVNMVMVALTGNYKADQVHVPALLERLGRTP